MRRARTTLPLLGLAVVALYALPYGLNSYAIHVVDIAIIYALLAIGMGLVMGVSGQINLAQIAFFGVGAYTTAILTTHAGYGFWLAAALGMLASVAVGLLVGVPALRMQSHYGLIVIREILVDFAVYAQLGYGIVVVLMVVFAPTGIAGIPTRIADLVRRRQGHTARARELQPFQPHPAVSTAHDDGTAGSELSRPGAAGSAPALEIRCLTKKFGAHRS